MNKNYCFLLWIRLMFFYIIGHIFTPYKSISEWIKHECKIADTWCNDIRECLDPLSYEQRLKPNTHYVNVWQKQALNFKLLGQGHFSIGHIFYHSTNGRFYEGHQQYPRPIKDFFKGALSPWPLWSPNILSPEKVTLLVTLSDWQSSSLHRIGEEVDFSDNFLQFILSNPETYITPDTMVMNCTQKQ